MSYLQWVLRVPAASSRAHPSSGMTLQVGTPSVALNPLAAEFVPCFLKRNCRKYTGWGRDGFDTRRGGQEVFVPSLQPAQPSYNILDAPDEVPFDYHHAFQTSHL